jgi:hypothetical protein
VVNAVIVYLEDDGHGNVRVSVEAIGKPVESIELCDAVMEELMESPNAIYMKSSVFTRVANQVQ